MLYRLTEYTPVDARTTQERERGERERERRSSMNLPDRPTGIDVVNFDRVERSDFRVGQFRHPRAIPCTVEGNACTLRSKCLFHWFSKHHKTLKTLKAHMSVEKKTAVHQHNSTSDVGGYS